jgi:SH3-like domain-containing protein
MNGKWMIVIGMGASLAFGQGVTNYEVRVTTGQVNLRARPEDGTEVVAQAQEGQSLTVVRMEKEWRGVLAPTNAQVWIKSEFVKKGLVSGDKIKLRSGPGISYRDIGFLKRDAAVREVEIHGEWTRIAPPAELILWVHESLVTSAAVAATNGLAATDPGPAATSAVIHVESAAPPVLLRDLPAGLTKERLAAVLGQGAMVERSGTVERVPLAFLRGVDYRLVGLREGVKVTVCFLEGNESQMPQLVGRRLIVKGREYWLKNSRYAVVYPELITPVVE